MQQQTTFTSSVQTWTVLIMGDSDCHRNTLSLCQHPVRDSSYTSMYVNPFNNNWNNSLYVVVSLILTDYPISGLSTGMVMSASANPLGYQLWLQSHRAKRIYLWCCGVWVGRGGGGVGDGISTLSFEAIKHVTNCLKCNIVFVNKCTRNKCRYENDTTQIEIL